MKINVRDDNWGDDPVGELEGTFFRIIGSYYAKPVTTQYSFVDPILMKSFEVMPTDTYKVFLNNYMPPELKNNVDFDITVNGGNLPFVKLNGLVVEIEPDYKDFGVYVVLVKIKNSPDSDLPDLLLRTQFDFTVPAVIATTPEEEKAK